MRDKVYGILGLVDEARIICPDYTKSLEDVFMDMMRSEARNGSHTLYGYEEIGRWWLSELNLSMKPDYSSFFRPAVIPRSPAATEGEDFLITVVDQRLAPELASSTSRTEIVIPCKKKKRKKKAVNLPSGCLK